MTLIMPRVRYTNTNYVYFGSVPNCGFGNDACIEWKGDVNRLTPDETGLVTFEPQTLPCC